MSTNPALQSPTSSMPQAADPALPAASTSAQPRRRRRLGNPSAARALAMLTLLPVRNLPVPRLHVEPREPDGSLRVFDRPSGESHVIYTPRFSHQFRAGHKAGRWYVRPACHVGPEPRSRAYPTARAAIEALDQGRPAQDGGVWLGPKIRANNRHHHEIETPARPFRVIWSTTEPSRD